MHEITMAIYIYREYIPYIKNFGMGENWQINRKTFANLLLAIIVALHAVHLPIFYPRSGQHLPVFYWFKIFQHDSIHIDHI